MIQERKLMLRNASPVLNWLANYHFLQNVPLSVFRKSIHTEMQSHTGEYIAEAVSGVIHEVKQECGKCLLLWQQIMKAT